MIKRDAARGYHITYGLEISKKKDIQSWFLSQVESGNNSWWIFVAMLFELLALYF